MFRGLLCLLLVWLAQPAEAARVKSLSPPGGGGGALLSVSNPTEPSSGEPLTRPLGKIWNTSLFVVNNANDYRYPAASFTASVNNPSAGVNDNLTIAAASSPGTVIVGPWYLNDSSTPPGTLINTATVHVPSVGGNIWNTTFSSGTGAPLPTPVTTSYVLQLRSSGGSIITSIPVKIDVLKRINPHFQRISHYLLAPPVPIDMKSSVFSGSAGGVIPVVSGSSVVLHTAVGHQKGYTVPGASTLTLQYTLDGVDIPGAQVTGPTTGGVDYTYPVTIDSTTLTDGTHAFGVRVIDYTGSDFPPYYFRCFQNLLIVMNTGSIGTFYNTSRTIPLIETSSGPNNRMNSSAVDFVTFPGLPSVSTLHQTAQNIPTPQAGVISPSSSSTLRGFPTVLYYNENLVGPVSTEYTSQQRFFTAPGGGVIAFPSYPEDVQSLEGNYDIEITKQTFDGSRDDTFTSNISSAIEGRDPTNSTPALRSFWLVFEATGRLMRLDYSGASTTLAGLRLNRSLLAFPPLDSTQYLGNGNLTESDYDGRLDHLGTIGSPSFGDLRGMNDGRYDPADSTFNTVYIANTLNQDIVKVTNLLGSPTMVRVAGQDAGLAGSATDTNHFTGDFQDGVATEFIDSGTTTATFTGAINGSTGVLTISGTYTGSTNLKACPIKWSGHTIPANGTLITTNISGSGSGSTWNTNYTGSNVSAIAMTAAGCVALFNRPYSIEISDGSSGLDPAGTIYVADTGNNVLRKIDTSGNVTTLFGNQANTSTHLPLADNSVASGATFGPFTITAWSWSGGLLSITTSSPVQQTTGSGWSQNYSIAHWWTLQINGTGNGNLDGHNFSVNAVTDSQHFNLWVPSDPSLGTAGGTITAFFADIFAPTDNTYHAWNHGSANEAYFPDIQRIVWSSSNPGLGSTSKHLIAGGPWTESSFDIDVANTQIRTIGTIYSAPNSRARFSSLGNNDSSGGFVGFDGISQISPSWYQVDVDSAASNGPVNDLLVGQSAASLDNFIWRLSFDGTSWTAPWGTQNNGQQSPLRFGLNTGGGHYPWAVAFSRTQGRVLTSGTSDMGLFQYRIFNGATDVPADPNIDTPTNYDTGAATRALSIFSQGSIQHWGYSDMVGFFPWGARPGMWSLHGSVQNNLLGLAAYSGGTATGSNTDSFDAINANIPSDSNLDAFIQGGFGGTVPRPELTGDDLADMRYFVRRSSIGGSLVVNAAAFPQRDFYQADVTAPVISSASCSRASSTSVTCTWTTDKLTYGFAACGFASGQASFSVGTFPYHMWKLEDWGGTALSSYKTTGHSVTVSGLKPSVTTYCVIYVKDLAGNNQVSSQQVVS